MQYIRRCPQLQRLCSRSRVGGGAHKMVDKMVEMKKPKNAQNKDFVAAVHCCRFANWMPASVSSLAYNDDQGLLAVGRGNGNIEIRNIEQNWRVDRTIAGKSDIPVSALCWYQDKDIGSRLIASTMDGTICEVDLNTLEFTNSQDSFGGPIWSMALSESSQAVAIGCEDGAVRIMSLDGGVSYLRTLQTLQERVLSLVWDENKDHLFSGGSDGTICQFDLKTGHSVQRMTLDRAASGAEGGAAALVWSLTLVDGSRALASGDSLGQVTVWDLRTGTAAQRLATHAADVLCLAAQREGDTQRLFASGVDSKVVCLVGLAVAAEEGKPGAGAGPGPSRWSVVDAHRPHSHDVKALCLARRDGKAVVVSGGLDTQLCVYSAAAFGPARPRRLWPFPHHRAVAVAPLRATTLLVAVQHDRRVDLWALDQGPAAGADLHAHADGDLLGAGDDEDGGEGTTAGGRQHRLWGRAELGENEGWNLSGIDLAARGDGSALLAFTGPGGTRVLCVNAEGGGGGLARVKGVPRRCRRAAQVLRFAPGGARRLALAAPAGELLILALPEAGRPALEHVFDPPDADADAPGPQARGGGGATSALAFSEDGQWLARALVGGDVHIYNMDTLQSWWRLPRLQSPVTALGFHPGAGSAPVLLTALASRRFLLWDAEDRRPAEWSRAQLQAGAEGGVFPPELLDRPEPITGVAFNPARAGECVLYGHGFLCRVDLGRPAPARARLFPPRHVSLQTQNTVQDDSEQQRKKRPRKDSNSAQTLSEKITADNNSCDSNNNFVICLKYKPMLHLGFHGPPNHMVIMENPWLKIVSQLPESLYRHRYGT